MNIKVSCCILLLFIICISALNGLENTKNPLKAMAFSAVVPGGGEIYNRAYVKACIVIGLQTYFISSAISDNNQVKHYNSLRDGSNSTNDLANLQQRNKYRDDLRSDYWWIGTTMFLSIADAFVDAHLYNFKAEKEKVHLKFGDKKLQLEYSF